MTTRALPLPGLRTPRRRAPRPILERESKGMSLGRLLGTALLGWFGLMVVVTALAV